MNRPNKASLKNAIKYNDETGVLTIDAYELCVCRDDLGAKRHEAKSSALRREIAEAGVEFDKNKDYPLSIFGYLIILTQALKADKIIVRQSKEWSKEVNSFIGAINLAAIQPKTPGARQTIAFDSFKYNYKIGVMIPENSDLDLGRQKVKYITVAARKDAPKNPYTTIKLSGPIEKRDEHDGYRAKDTHIAMPEGKGTLSVFNDKGGNLADVITKDAIAQTKLYMNSIIKEEDPDCGRWGDEAATLASRLREYDPKNLTKNDRKMLSDYFKLQNDSNELERIAKELEAKKKAIAKKYVNTGKNQRS